jgi:hypothetical protein
VSICTHCGQEHDATASICPGANQGSGRGLQESAKTLYGFPSPAIPGLPRAPGARPGLAATLLSPSAKLPAPRPRLPTAEEVRQNPNLVITLDVTRPAPASPAGNGAGDLPPAFAGSDTAVDLPSVEPPVDLPPRTSTVDLGPPPEGTPTDLPPPGSGERFALPEPPASAKGYAAGQPGQPGQPSTGNLAERLAADLKSVVNLLASASNTYLVNPKPFLVLAAFLVLPASIVQSCLVAGITSRPPDLAFSPGVTTVDFSARKAELAARIRESQTRGQLDQPAAVELAALTQGEPTQLSLPGVQIREGVGWVRERLALFIQGLLVLGLAFPAACGALAIALFDRESGAACPTFADLWPILLGRGELFLISLLPAALLVALGNALFVLPGLVLSVLFLFVPHVVLFEKKGGRIALLRSIEVAKGDPIRTVLAFLAFALAGAAVAVFTELLLPTTGSRAVAFLHFIAADLLAVALLPIPALVLARLYLSHRSPSGANAERLSRAARS